MSNFLRIMGPILLALLACNGCGGGGSSSTAISSTARTAADNGAESAKLIALAGECAGGYADGGSNGVIQVIGAPGINPTVTASVNGSTTTTTIDYGSGITSGGETISGSVAIAYDSSTNSGTITFTRFTQTAPQGTTTISGTVGFTVTPTGSGASTIHIDNNLDVTTNSQSYNLTGTATADVSNSQGLLDISTAHETLTSAQGTFTATATDLTFDSATHRVNGGAIDATYQAAGSPITTSAVVTFNGQTPATGIVLVALDGSAAVPVQVPSSNL